MGIIFSIVVYGWFMGPIDTSGSDGKKISTAILAADVIIFLYTLVSCYVHRTHKDKPRYYPQDFEDEKGSDEKIKFGDIGWIRLIILIASGLDIILMSIVKASDEQFISKPYTYASKSMTSSLYLLALVLMLFEHEGVTLDDTLTGKNTKINSGAAEPAPVFEKKVSSAPKSIDTPVDALATVARAGGG